MKILPIILALAVSACTTVPFSVAEAERAEKAQAKKAIAVVKSLPDWYTAPPDSTQAVVFTVGSGVSSNLQMSRSKAVLDAQTNLADQLNAVVSSLTKQYLRDTGRAATMEDTEIATKKIVAEANVAGYRVEKLETFAEGVDIRTFVMLSYPVGSTNAIRTLQDQAKAAREMPAKRAEAFAELSTDVENQR
jgi:hypothetical protein